ncbi:hypothetical protein CapIbe_012568 [Capra ibex]
MPPDSGVEGMLSQNRILDDAFPTCGLTGTLLTSPSNIMMLFGKKYVHLDQPAHALVCSALALCPSKHGSPHGKGLPGLTASVGQVSCQIPTTQVDHNSAIWNLRDLRISRGSQKAALKDTPCMCHLWNVLFLFCLCMAWPEIQSSHKEDLIGQVFLMYQPSAMPGSFARNLVEGASGDSWIRAPHRIAAHAPRLLGGLQWVVV